MYPIGGGYTHVAKHNSSSLALWFGIEQIRSSREDSREATAKQIWKDYHLHGIQYSELANPDFSKLDYEKEEYDGDRGKFYDYQWFVSLMLLACDEVIRLRVDLR